MQNKNYVKCMKMENRDFEKQWNNCKEVYTKAKCPLDNNELEGIINRAMTATQHTASKPNTKSRRLWIWAGRHGKSFRVFRPKRLLPIHLRFLRYGGSIGPRFRVRVRSACPLSGFLRLRQVFGDGKECRWTCAHCRVFCRL